MGTGLPLSAWPSPPGGSLRAAKPPQSGRERDGTAGAAGAGQAAAPEHRGPAGSAERAARPPPGCRTGPAGAAGWGTAGRRGGRRPPPARLPVRSAPHAAPVPGSPLAGAVPGRGVPQPALPQVPGAQPRPVPRRGGRRTRARLTVPSMLLPPLSRSHRGRRPGARRVRTAARGPSAQRGLRGSGSARPDAPPAAPGTRSRCESGRCRSPAALRRCSGGGRAVQPRSLCRGPALRGRCGAGLLPWTGGGSPYTFPAPRAGADPPPVVRSLPAAGGVHGSRGKAGQAAGPPLQTAPGGTAHRPRHNRALHPPAQIRTATAPAPPQPLTHQSPAPPQLPHRRSPSLTRAPHRRTPRRQSPCYSPGSADPRAPRRRRPRPGTGRTGPAALRAAWERVGLRQRAHAQAAAGP